MTVKFFYNAIQIDNNKKELVHIDYGKYRDGVWRVSLYSRNNFGFSDAVKKVFAVKNDSDIVTDYFENDKITIDRNSHYFVPALKAVKQDLLKSIARVESRKLRYPHLVYQGNNFDCNISRYRQTLLEVEKAIDRKSGNLKIVK